MQTEMKTFVFLTVLALHDVQKHMSATGRLVAVAIEWPNPSWLLEV